MVIFERLEGIADDGEAYSTRPCESSDSIRRFLNIVEGEMSRGCFVNRVSFGVGNADELHDSSVPPMPPQRGYFSGLSVIDCSGRDERENDLPVCFISSSSCFSWFIWSCNCLSNVETES